MADDLQYRLPLRAGASTQPLALIFVALVVLSLIALDTWQILNSRAQALHSAQVTTSNLARSLTQHADDSFAQTDTVLSGLIERVQVDGTSAAALVRLRHLMQGWKQSLPQLHGLFVYDRDGRWVVTANTVDPPGMNNADREYFQFHRNNPDPGLHIGPVIRSRSNNAWVIPVSRRLQGADGSFAGVVLATLKLDYFTDFYAAFDIDERGAIVLALRDGTLLARRPFEANVIGTSVARGRIFSQMLPAAGQGTLMQLSMVDAVERMYSYRASSQYPLVLEAALSRQAILADWHDYVLRSSLVVLLVMVAMGVCAIALIRQIRLGQRAEAQLRNAHAALQKLAMQDGLTGLANRRQLDAALPDEMGRARRSGRPLGLIMLDIDHFKRFNDLYGHPAGDECIRAVGQAVLACVGRAGDLVVRYGGEELLVLLPQSDESGTWQVAEKILQTVRSLAIHHAGNDPGIVTISAGVHVWRHTETNLRAQNLVQAADQALYEAKSHGRNRLYPPMAAAVH